MVYRYQSVGTRCAWVVIASGLSLLLGPVYWEYTHMYTHTHIHAHTHTRTHTHVHTHTYTRAHTHAHTHVHTHTHTHTPLSIYHLLLYLVSILYPQHRVHSSLSLSLFITPLSRVLDNMTPKILNASTYMLNHKNSFRIANLYTQQKILLTRIQYLPLVWGI